jgi:hypothetical protein
MFEISKKMTNLHQNVLLNNIERYIKNSPNATTIHLDRKAYDKLYALVPDELQKAGVEMSYQGRWLVCRG